MSSRHRVIERLLLYDDDSGDDEDLTALGSLVLYGALLRRERRRERRKLHRHYLCRPQLLPNPRFNTPWQQLYASQDRRAFIVTMAFDPDTFQYILDSGFTATWNSFTIPRPDTSRTGNPRPGARSLDAAGALGLALHFLASSIPGHNLHEIFALIPSTTSRYIDWSIRILRDVLRGIPEASISWPTEERMAQDNALITARHPLLTGATAAIDGLRLPTQVSRDRYIENASYNGWTHDHNTVNVLVFSPRGVIILCSLNCPGSWHDSQVARPIYEKLRVMPDEYYLVADTAFPRGAQAVARHIKAPMKRNTVLPADAEERNQMMEFNRQLTEFRQIAEWGMRAVQGAWGRLRVPLPVDDVEGRGDLLEVCFRLTNLRTVRTGINQISEVYEKVWEEEEPDMWQSLGGMLFSDIRRNDRVARFHGVVVELPT